MTIEECDEWMQHRALQRDVEDLMQKGEVEEIEEEAQDFQQRSE